jgi:hypothetical protein
MHLGATVPDGADTLLTARLIPSRNDIIATTRLSKQRRRCGCQPLQGNSAEGLIDQLRNERNKDPVLLLLRVSVSTEVCQLEAADSYGTLSITRKLLERPDSELPKTALCGLDFAGTPTPSTLTANYLSHADAARRLSTTRLFYSCGAHANGLEHGRRHY